jgi:hypothetical protein
MKNYKISKFSEVGESEYLKPISPHIFYDVRKEKFYFADETEDLIGPYDDYVSAETALKRYIRALG